MVISTGCSGASSPAWSTWRTWTSRPPGPGASGSVRHCAQPGVYLDGLFDYLLHALQSLPLAIVLGAPQSTGIPVLSFALSGVPAERVVQRLADNGILAIPNAASWVLDLIGVGDIGGAVTIGLAHYSTTYEVDQFVRALASLGWRPTRRPAPPCRSPHPRPAVHAPRPPAVRAASRR